MKKLLYILGASAFLALPAAAQEKRSGKLGEYDEIIIKKKHGAKDAKVTIEIKDGEVLADGKKLSDYKGNDVIIQRRIVTPRDGNMSAGGNEESFPIRANKALLGVITEKKEAAGATVVEVSDDSPAAKAGLKVGDVITAVNDKKIAEPQDLFETIGGMEPGDKVTISYRRNGQEKKADATLDKREDEIQRFFRMPGNQQPFGFNMPQSPRLRAFPYGGNEARLGLSVQDTEAGNGAKVLRVTDGSAAEKAGFKENDIVTEIGGKPVRSARDVAEAYRSNKEKGSMTAKVQRDGSAQTLTITVPKQLNTENL
ncbi:PDZ domain-containing protein [Chitinophaga lutea]